MSEQFQLRVITPQRSVVDQSVLEATAPGTVGEFGVLPDHARFLSSLESGRLSFRDGRGMKNYAVREGFAEVVDNVMTVLTEAAEAAAEIDTARARADLQEAEFDLSRLAPIDPEFAAADSRRRWAQARLEVAGIKS